MAPDHLNAEAINAQFPALVKYPDFTFGDNAGGSQIVQAAIDRITDYLINTNAQMGSDYAPASTQRCVTEAQASAAELFNAQSPDEIGFGASSTQNLDNLAVAIEDNFSEDDELIVTGEHETNAGPWKRLAARRGVVVKRWKYRLLDPLNPYSLALDLEDLLPLISDKTRLVAFPACSNVLGSVLPVKKIVEAVRTEAAAKKSGKIFVSLDCVAYAPHRQIDVQDWDVDICFLSYYKVFGPHVGGMYVRRLVLEQSVKSTAHHFLSPGVDKKGFKIQPFGGGYESVWGSTAVVPYLKSLTLTGTLEAGYESIAAHDIELAATLLSFLTAEPQRRRGIRVVGSETPGPDRMPTISFVVIQGSNAEREISSKELVADFDARGKVGIRYGHFYAYTLVSEAVSDAGDGIVRVSFVHYSTQKDVEKFVATMKEILYTTQ